MNNADRIIVLDNHKIIGEGKHSELYKDCSIYRQLYDEQFPTD